MAPYVKVIVIGHLGADPTSKAIPSGDMVTEFSVATTEKKKDGTESTTWWRCSAFRRTGEIAQQFLAKGSPVYIEGSLTIRSYTDKEGKDRFSPDVRVQELRLIGSRSDGETVAPARQAAGAGADNDGWDDTIPF